MLNTHSNFSNSSYWETFPDTDSGSATSKSKSWMNSAVNDSGLANLSRDKAAWHQKMGKAFGYDSASPSPEKAASESFRQALLKSVQTGDFSQLNLPIEAVPGQQMDGRPAAFLGGDTATSDDDRIVVNQDLLKQAAHDSTAQAQLNDAITEEFMHGLERKIHHGKSGDIQLNAAGEIAFMQEGQGHSFDEGKFAREFLKEPYHNFEDLQIDSAVNDHGIVYMNGEAHKAEFRKKFQPYDEPHPIEEIANDNKDHSVRYRLNNNPREWAGKDKWHNSDINEVFDGPDAFRKIWDHHEHDQDLNGWLGTANMKGSRGNTKGVTKYVGWVLDQADTGKAPKAEAEKRKLLGEGGVLGDNAWLNSRNNDEIDGNGSDKTVGIDANLLKHVPAEQLVALKGTRAGTNNVQEGIGQQLAQDPVAYANLQAYFSQDDNGAKFLNKFTDDEIRTMDPYLLAAIPIEQINTAEGTRGVAALQKIFDPQIGGKGEYKNPGNWVNHTGFKLSPESQEIFHSAQEAFIENLQQNTDYSPLAKSATQANVKLPSLFQEAQRYENIYSEKLEKFGIKEPPEELRAGYSLEKFGNKAPELPSPEDKEGLKRYVKDILTDLGYSVTTDIKGNHYVSGHGLRKIPLEIDQISNGTLAAYSNAGNLTLNSDYFKDLQTELLSKTAETSAEETSIYRSNARASVAGLLIHELSHAKQDQGGYQQKENIDGIYFTTTDNKDATQELAAHWQEQQFLLDWLKENSSDPNAMHQISSLSEERLALFDFFRIYNKELDGEFQQAVEMGVNDAASFLKFVKNN